MSILSIIIIILIIFGIAVFFKVVKNVFKAAIYVFVLLAILLFILGVSVYTDAASFRKNIQEKPLSFVLVDDDQVLAGMKIVDMENNEVLLFSQETLSGFESAYENKNFDKILDNSYKVFFFNLSVLKDLNNSLEYEDYNISSAAGISILESSEPLNFAAGYFAEKKGFTDEKIKEQFRKELEQEFNSDQEFKDAVFSLFVAELFPSQTLYIVKNIKKGEIVVYPETAMFKALNYVPEEWIVKNSQRGVTNQS